MRNLSSNAMMISLLSDVANLGGSPTRACKLRDAYTGKPIQLMFALKRSGERKADPGTNLLVPEATCRRSFSFAS